MNIEARTADHGSNARQLAAAAEPVFIFDGRQPVLVWANEAALAFIGSGAPAQPDKPLQLPHLDRSMPALSRLRALAEGDLPASGIKLDLVFWTARGARSLTCHCRRATFAFAPEALIVHGLDPKAIDERDGADTVGIPAATQPGEPKVRAPQRKASKARTAKTAKNNKTAKNKKSKDRRTTRQPAQIVGIAPAITPPPASPTPLEPPPPHRADATPAPRPHVAAPVQRQPSAPPAALPPHRTEASGDSIALREIARQIQSATSAHFAARRSATKADEPSHDAPVTSAIPAPATARLIAPQPPPQSPALSAQEPDFLSQIGHEIRTPLNSILGFAEIMREERLGPVGNARYKSYAADIHDSATHALSLINDLLDLSRLEAGGVQLDPVEVEVPSVIAQAVASLLPIAEKAGVVVSAPAGRPLPRLLCDARALKQMLLNLLSNAIKHTDSGGAVWTTAAVGDGGGLVIRVQDTGVGLSEEDLAVALQPYRQVGAAERRAGGTGLGLPLTKAMVEANGGRLVLERISGGGLAALLVFDADRVVRP